MFCHARFFESHPTGKLTNDHLGQKGKKDNEKIGHAVVIVGVGRVDNGECFKIKNSWGDNGHFRACGNVLPFDEFHILDQCSQSRTSTT